MLLQRKRAAVLAAVSLSALLVLGTFAWTNFDSRIINEWRGLANGGSANDGPGGTLHNNHQANSEHKTVFVENWGNEVIFARIRLDEYMEFGTGAGLKGSIDPSTGDMLPNPENQAVPLVSSADINDIQTWEPHVVNRASGNCNSTAEFCSYWEWGLGGEPIYFFPAPESQRQTPSFIASHSPHGLTAESVNNNGQQTQLTGYATILTMDEWLDLSDRKGNFWVVDTDGWIYWANEIQPSEATGLFLNSVVLLQDPTEDYYYGISVQAQMATATGLTDDGEINNYNSFGFDINGGWTDNGQYLMDYITYNMSSPYNPDLSPTPSVPAYGTPSVPTPSDPTPSIPTDPPTPSPDLPVTLVSATIDLDSIRIARQGTHVNNRLASFTYHHTYSDGSTQRFDTTIVVSRSDGGRPFSLRCGNINPAFIVSIEFYETDSDGDYDIRIFEIEMR